MNILSKLNEVTINNTNRIAETDIKFCENQYKQYVSAREALQQALNIIKPAYEEEKKSLDNSLDRCYLNEYRDIDPIEKRLEEIKEYFISEVVHHFSRQYKVTLDTAVINKKYDIYLTQHDIIAEIFEQLGGFNFEEKAVHELIEASKAQIYNFDKVSIKKASLSITDFVWWDSWGWDGLRISWKSKKENSLFTALSHFENGDVKMLDSLFNMYKEMEKGSKHYDIFNKYEFDCEKFKSIKIFKNGKITIEFKNQTLAQEFANTYLKK
ncbi:hypothetical protein [Bacillus amyloliquefaciens]|uniref:hypothetical protein n=1 Tax=Bacillus amyloliquefaciens TaxID=1390 RepID=UPI000E26DBFD|nr:hypothetical protein [Bacillus amyloliquefaciens]RDY83175.1 hypothetical protein C3733_20160 [Bacillus amyloliquefaciens]